MSTDIYYFDMRGDKHLDEMLAVACASRWGDKPIDFYGWVECEGSIRFYDGGAKDRGINLFPAPMTDVKETLLAWLRNQSWSTKGQDYDVIYHRGFRIFNTVNSYEHGFIFAVEPFWTEYHK